MNCITKSRMGIYAGSFSPFHIGHLNIVKQAQLVFDKILVAKGINPEKNNDFNKYPLPEKFLTTTGAITIKYTTLLVDIIKEYECDYNVTLVRGLRSGADLEYEQNFAAFLKSMYPSVKIVAFYCDPVYRHISSSALRGIQKISDMEYKKYVVSEDFEKNS